MAKKRNYDHSHIYMKLSNGRSFKCLVPDCPHITNGAELLIGNRAQCPYCLDTFIITNEHLRRRHIHCMLCTKNGVSIPKVEKPRIAEDVSRDDIFRGLLETEKQIR